MSRRTAKIVVAAGASLLTAAVSWLLYSDLRSASSPESVNAGDIVIVADAQVSKVNLWLDIESDVPSADNSGEMLLRFAYQMGHIQSAAPHVEVLISGPIADGEINCRSPIAQPEPIAYVDLGTMVQISLAEHFTDLAEKEAAGGNLEDPASAISASDKGLDAAKGHTYSRISVDSQLTDQELSLALPLDRTTFPFVTFRKFECDVPSSALWSRTELGAVLSTPNVAYATRGTEADTAEFSGVQRIKITSGNDVVLRDTDPLVAENDGNFAEWTTAAGRETYPAEGTDSIIFGNHEGVYARFEEVDSSETRDFRLLLLGASVSICAAALFWCLDSLFSDPSDRRSQSSSTP